MDSSKITIVMTMVAQSATALIANLSHNGRFGRLWSFHVDSLIVSISEPLSNLSCQIPPPLQPATLPIFAVGSSSNPPARIG